jgi:ribosomal-protein-alanine N-acetyltransferase
VAAVPVLKGKHVVLRPPRPTDKVDRFACGRNSEYVRMMGGDYGTMPPLTPEEVDVWYDRMTSEPCCWAIDNKRQCIGTTRLHSLEPAHRRARYAIGIFNAAAWGLGLGTEATRLVVKHGFETLGLHRIDLRVLAYNERAIASYKKCGFVVEGIERDSALVEGEWHDDVMMSILEHEYRKLAKRWRW